MEHDQVVLPDWAGPHFEDVPSVIRAEEQGVSVPFTSSLRNSQNSIACSIVSTLSSCLNADSRYLNTIHN